MNFPFALSHPVATRQPAARAAVAKLGLSTGGFGLGGKLSKGRASAGEAEAHAAICVAMEAGVRLIDTGPSHGNAEAIIGGLLSPRASVRLVTRAAALAIGVDQVEQRAQASLERFGMPSAGAILADAADLLTEGGPLLWASLTRLKDEGYFDCIGIFVEAHDDVVGLARRFKPDLLQAPASLLDQRLIVSGALASVAALGIEVHLRSVFLQGLLFTPREGLNPKLAEAGPRLSRIRRMIAEAGADPLQAALAFALGRPEASAVIVEASSAAELKAVIAAASAPAPQLEWSALALDHAAALDSERPARRSAAA